MSKSSSPLGQRIKERRLELKLTTQELALRVGITSASFISMVEYGRSLVPLDRAIEFAAGLQVPELPFILDVIEQYSSRVAERLRRELGLD